MNKEDHQLTPSQRLRKLIREAANKAGLTHEDIDNNYRALMSEEGQTAPKSIMRKVTDKRRPFEFKNVEARCMGRVLKIPHTELLEAQLPQKNVSDQNVTTQVHQDEAPRFTPEENFSSKSPANDTEVTKTKTLDDFEHHGSVRFTDTSKGLFLDLDLILTAQQFERLTLAIPAYMMKIQKDNRSMHCKARVNIFPYQAELIMRAIYGAR